jgi:rare lipoprotein A (peptidoglycan hydrolase)
MPMRAKILFGLQSVFLGLGLLVLTPSVNPTTLGSASNPSQPLEMSLQDSIKFPVPAAPATSSSHKRAVKQPLAVWQCLTGWYGEDFDGKSTANGETYDMYGITAAHPTLPLGSVVRVVNMSNHRSQVVRINDRGPYVQGRELDVSYEVARRLGFDAKGLAKVRVELLEVPSRPNLERHN